MAQHFIVQEKLLAHKALQGITFERVSWYWPGPRTRLSWRNSGGEPCSPDGEPDSQIAQPPALRSGGGGSASPPDACRLRWVRAMIRARMRKPVCIFSRSWAVCCGDVPPGVFRPAFPDFRLLPEGRPGLFLLVSFRISSRWWCVIGPPRLAGVSLSGSCRSPFIGLGQRRLCRCCQRV